MLTNIMKPYVSSNLITFNVSVIMLHRFGLMRAKVRILGYRSGGPGSIPGTIKKKSNGSGTGSIQPREYN
jgi:hypothetical protein